LAPIPSLLARSPASSAPSASSSSWRLSYGLFGVFANIALFVNISLILAALSVLGATLTLPGIAGIVLTVGMAVDSNVLIFERIREEVRRGRKTIAAIDVGFREALRTILDANITTLIAAIILFPAWFRTRARLCRDASHRHRDHGLHRLHAHPSLGSDLGEVPPPYRASHLVPAPKGPPDVICPDQIPAG
jgi:hypothetical protein